MAGAINNFGLISGYGLISGITLLNPGTITQSDGPLTITATSPGTNTAAINGASGLPLHINSGFTGNDGTVSLNGGFLTNAALFTNNVAGLITGPGTISGQFQNAGTLVATGGALSITNAWTNIGTVNLSGVGRGVIRRSGYEQQRHPGAPARFRRTSRTPAAPLKPLGGTLTLSGTLTNPGGASLYASTGNKILVTAGLATNAGVISLTGGAFDNNNHPLDNTGQITGFGTIRTGRRGRTHQQRRPHPHRRPLHHQWRRYQCRGKNAPR